MNVSDDFHMILVLYRERLRFFAYDQANQLWVHFIYSAIKINTTIKHVFRAFLFKYIVDGIYIAQNNTRIENSLLYK